MDKLFVDFLGPLTRTKRGNSAILVVLKGFSKFVCFNPVRRISSQVGIFCLEKNYFPTYGTPNPIVTDNARVFWSKQVKDLCFRWGVNHITTTPYYPQGLLTKRVSRNLKSAPKIFHHRSQNTWDEDISWLDFAFNTATHGSIDTTAICYLLVGKLSLLLCPDGIYPRWIKTVNFRKDSDSGHRPTIT